MDRRDALSTASQHALFPLTIFGARPRLTESPMSRRDHEQPQHARFCVDQVWESVSPSRVVPLFSSEQYLLKAVGKVVEGRLHFIWDSRIAVLLEMLPEREPRFGWLRIVCDSSVHYG